MDARVTHVKCPQCGTKWEFEGLLDDDFDADTTCPDCHWEASAWNLIPEAEDEV